MLSILCRNRTISIAGKFLSGSNIYFFLINVFIYFIFGCVGSPLLRVGFSLVAASKGYSLLRFAGFSSQWLLLLWSTGSRRAGSVVVARGL